MSRELYICFVQTRRRKISCSYYQVSWHRLKVRNWGANIILNDFSIFAITFDLMCINCLCGQLAPIVLRDCKCLHTKSRSILSIPKHGKIAVQHSINCAWIITNKYDENGYGTEFEWLWSKQTNYSGRAQTYRYFQVKGLKCMHSGPFEAPANRKTDLNNIQTQKHRNTQIYTYPNFISLKSVHIRRKIGVASQFRNIQVFSPSHNYENFH